MATLTQSLMLSPKKLVIRKSYRSMLLELDLLENYSGLNVNHTSGDIANNILLTI